MCVERVLYGSMHWEWMVWQCFYPTIQQGVGIGIAVVAPCILLRLLVLYSGLKQTTLNILATVLGILILWWFYNTSLSYFLLLCALVYILLLVIPQRKGAAVSLFCVVFIFSCELFVASKEEWHKVRGSFLVVSMKNISLAFDLEGQQDDKKEHKPPRLHSVPDLPAYTSYCLFPGTTVFGPFITYSEHCKFLHGTPLSVEWALRILSSLFVAAVCLGLSVCILPFLFLEPHYNKWMAAYPAAASFRYGHYFICFLSQSSVIASGMGYELKQDTSISWSYRVVHPLSIEVPHSMPTVVTNWNLPMHDFLKYYVYKPSRYYLGQFTAILLTFTASALLHGFNYQLTAIILSLGVYAYIESVFRRKLSKKLDACVLDRPCRLTGCEHRYKSRVWWVVLINVGFVLLNIFHLAYAGVMFDVTSEEAGLQQQGFSLMHTLKKWAHLNFLSHWVAAGTFLLSWLL